MNQQPTAQQLANEIEELVAINRAQLSEPTPTDSIDVAQLASNAVLAQFEAANAAVKSMGDQIKDRVKALEECLAECRSDLKLLEETAQAIAAKGTFAAAQVAHATSVLRDVRAAVAEINKRLA